MPHDTGPLPPFVASRRSERRKRAANVARQHQECRQRYERGSTIVTSNLPFEDWTSVLGSERLTHHVSILTMNGDSYRLRQSASRHPADNAARAEQNPATNESDPETGEITTG